jgi:acetyl-CoA acetyltransferase
VSDDVYVVGSAWQNVASDSDQQLDELVFDVASAALRSAGASRHQVDVSIVSSLDLYDGRSISNALTAPAAAGYLNEDVRIEGDAMAAVIFAIAALLSGRADTALVTGLHIPEIGTSDEWAIGRFREKVSSYTFDAHLDRPVGMTSEVTLGLHAASLVAGGAADVTKMAAQCAREITSGASRRGTRPAATAQDVLDSAPVVGPLTALMLPAASAGLGSVVLSIGATARRYPGVKASVTGWGWATSHATSQPEWLTDPAAATRRAADQAYARAKVDPAQITTAEMTDLSPYLTEPIADALGLSKLDPQNQNPSGGVRSNYPGIANGLLRLIELTDTIAASADPTRGVAHSVDDLCGLISSTASVLTLSTP